MQEQKELNVLITGEPLDAGRVFALVQLDVINVALDFHLLQRQAVTMATPRTAQERHMQTHGHRLRFGCCAGESNTRAEEEQQVGHQPEWLAADIRHPSWIGPRRERTIANVDVDRPAAAGADTTEATLTG